MYIDAQWLLRIQIMMHCTSLIKVKLKLKHKYENVTHKSIEIHDFGGEAMHHGLYKLKINTGLTNLLISLQN